jgi:hypothetical protein
VGGKKSKGFLQVLEVWEMVCVFWPFKTLFRRVEGSIII